MAPRSRRGHAGRAPAAALAMLGLVVALQASDAWSQPFEVPDGSHVGAHLNVWVREPFDTQPVAFLEPEREYEVVVDLAWFDYDQGFEPRSVSDPITGFEDLARASFHGVPVTVELVVEDDRERALGEGDEPPYFVPEPPESRVDVVQLSPRRVERVLSEPPVFVGDDAFRLMRRPDARGAFLSRSTFKVTTRGFEGAAPVAVVLWDGDRAHQVLSTRFCVARPEERSRCQGLPRHSEYFLALDARLSPPIRPFFRDGVIVGAPGPPPQPPPPPEPSAPAIYWNSWLARSSATEAEPLHALKAATDPLDPAYVLALDLASLVYADRLGLTPEEAPAAMAEASFGDLLVRLRDAGITSYPIVARAAVLGEGLEIVGERRHDLTVDLSKIGEVDAAALAGVDSIEALSQAVAAAALRLKLRAEAPTCAAVAISITDETGIRPLDHVVREVRVVDAEGEGPECGGPVLPGLSAGLGSALAVWKAPRLAASLHLFEFAGPDGATGAAFFVASDGSHHAWEMQRPFTEYLADPQNLEARIERARALSRDGVLHAYDGAARELAGALFAARARPHDRAEAAAAREALEALARGAEEPPAVLVRLENAAGEIVFVPLGILAAPGEERVLEGPIRVIQPLPVEDYLSEGCVGSWAFGISDALEGPTLAVPEPVKESGSWLGDPLESLRQWLHGSTPPEHGEGLVLVAHHDGGRLRYVGGEEPIQLHDLLHPFGAGGAALLAMCSGTGPEPVDNRVLYELNRVGLDAAIASPFALKADYGKAVAVEFALAVEAARAAGETPTLGTLFERATAAARRRIEEEAGGPVVGDMHLELALLGNPDLRLCPAGGSP